MGTLSSELAPHAERLSPHPRIYADANVPAGLVAYMRQRLHWDVLFVLEGLPRVAVQAVGMLGVAGFAWGVWALPGFDMCGLRPIRDHLRGVPEEVSKTALRAKPFLVRGPYRWVRHPLYSSIIVLLWADPRMSVGRLVINIVWTAWICVGARLEEGDLVAEFGERYLRYREQVPFLVPWRRPMPESTWR